MADPLTQLEALAGREPRVVLATLVAAKGSVPRGAGARMLVGASGAVLGTVTIGGCVDARVVEEAPRALADGKPRRLSLELGDDDAMALGLTCGGRVDLLLEPVAPHDAGDPVVAAARALGGHARAGRDAACVARLDGVRGRLVVGADGAVAGSLGDAALDGAAYDAARAALAAGSSRLADAHDAAGVAVPLFVERHAPPETLVVFGASAVAVALVRMAKMLGWTAIVADGRERWATRERFPDADALHVGMLGDVARSLAIGRRTAVVLVAHDYKFELPVLRTVLAGDPGYVGLLGSRRRGAAVLDLLAGEGVPAARRACVHVPVGLDIGARTPEEIALAVMAEAVAVLRGRSGAPLRDGVARSPDAPPNASPDASHGGTARAGASA